MKVFVVMTINYLILTWNDLKLLKGAFHPLLATIFKNLGYNYMH